jgi:hypothetical protein
MKVVGSELGNFFSVGAKNIGICDVPLFGNGPVEYGCSAWYFVLDEWNDLLKNIHRLSQAVARYASANGPKTIEVMFKFFR